jgi:adenylosuccinate synthase
MLSADVIVGALWGDEGKGKYVGWVGHRYDVVMRVNASTNAGHCVDDGSSTQVTRQLPSVFFPKRTQLVLAPGALLNLASLEQELAGRPDIDGLAGNFAVASSISLVIRPYIEKGQGGRSKLIGSTHQGTGPSAVARTARHSLRLFDVQHVVDGSADERREVLAKIERTCRETSPLLFADGSEETRAYAAGVLDELVSAYRRIEEMVGGFCVDYSRLLTGWLRRGEARVLIEGCNGMLLDNLHGALPHVTSAPTNLAAMLCGANLSPRNAGELVVVMATYSTCLGKRPFPTEMTPDEAAHFYANCNEVDVAEHNARRLGWLDLPALRKALVGAEGAALHMNKMDVLSGLPRIKVCTHYRIDGRDVEVMPDDPSLVARSEPCYELFEGWDEPISDVRELTDLPANARRYVEFVEENLSFSVASLGVGPKNGDIIEIR